MRTMTLIAAALLAGTAAPAAHAASPAKPLATASKAHGALDLDVTSTSGRTLGHLQGHLARNGKGILIFRAAPGVKAPTELVHGTSTDGGSLKANGTALDATAAIAKNGRVTGRGTLDGKAITITGAGREASARPAVGMKMLVVGKASGTAYDALKTIFDPVRYDPRKHSRTRFLAQRRDLRRYGALVIGNDVSAKDLRGHELLRSFYGSGRWIVTTTNTPATNEVLAAIHSGMTGAGQAVAVRQAGPRGNASRVKLTVPFPTVKTKPERAARNDWFRSEIVRGSKAHMHSAREVDADPKIREPAKARMASAGDPATPLGSSSATFNLPVNATAYEIAISQYTSITSNATANNRFSQPCAMNVNTGNTWCEGSWYWEQQAVAVGDTDDSVLADRHATCEWFLNQGSYDILPYATVSKYGRPNDYGAYTLYWDQFPETFALAHGTSDTCPADNSQTSVLQGRVYYYVIYNPEGANGSGTHSLVALTDPTFSASTNQQGNGALALEGAANGHGGWYEQNFDPDPGGGRLGYVRSDWPLQEDAWYLGRYDTEITLKGPSGEDLPTNLFEYSEDKSYPNNTITWESDTQGTSESRSFTIGTIDATTTTGYGESTTEDSNVSISVPDWKVLATPGTHAMKYSWQTNTPIPWAQIMQGSNMPNWDKGVPWSYDDSGRTSDPFSPGPGADKVINTLNRSGFSPATVTGWVGDASYGQISVDLENMGLLVDHFSLPGADGIYHGYLITGLADSESPDDLTPDPKYKPVSAGINLCDPMVEAPQYKSTATQDKGCPYVAP